MIYTTAHTRQISTAISFESSSKTTSDMVPTTALIYGQPQSTSARASHILCTGPTKDKNTTEGWDMKETIVRLSSTISNTTGIIWILQ